MIVAWISEPIILTYGLLVKSISSSWNIPGPTSTTYLLVNDVAVKESTADLTDVKSPPFFATVIILGSWFTSYRGALILIFVLVYESVPWILPVAPECAMLTSIVLFSKFNAIASILGAAPICGASIPTAHLWKFTAVNLKNPPFST